MIREAVSRTGALPESLLLRRGVLALAALGAIGTAVELVFLRHWQTATQLIVWPTLLTLLVAVTALTVRPTASIVRRVRALAMAVTVVAALAIGFHVAANLDAGPLDRNYASSWTQMSSVEQWWLAITGGVGPAPALAPGALAEIALAVLLATLRHPALATGGHG